MRGAWMLVLLAVLALPGVGYAGDFRLTSPTIKDRGTIGNDHVFKGF